MLDNMPICALLDGKLLARLAEIIAKRGITTVVETGVDKGGSTMLFSEMVPHVIGIDNDLSKVDIVKTSLKKRGITNVVILLGNSPAVLCSLVNPPINLDTQHTLFFLDAHWQAYWPLKDEIRAIPRKHGVLVMHDARVPGCPNLGVDEYNGQELSYEYLRDVLTEWSSEHVVEYNDDTAEFPRRGVMFVYPS